MNIAAWNRHSLSVAGHISVSGEDVVCDHRGVLFLPDWSALVVSDLHLEKGSSLARRGSLVPPYDTLATLQRLIVLIDAYNPKMVICLGDSFHDNDGAGRLTAQARTVLHAMMAGREWIWIAGNHDDAVSAGISGESVSEAAIGALTFRHIPGTTATGELSGHLHPGARIFRRGRSLRRRCFVTDGNRLILPAFGAYTGMLNILDAAYANLFDPELLTAHVMGASGIHQIRRKHLRPG